MTFFLLTIISQRNILNDVTHNVNINRARQKVKPGSLTTQRHAPSQWMLNIDGAAGDRTAPVAKRRLPKHAGSVRQESLDEHTSQGEEIAEQLAALP